MGSCFLPDDYMPDLQQGFKKDSLQSCSNGGSQGGIFDNYPCFAHIKKELGFFDSRPPLNTPPGERFMQDRARSSPVIDRLILEEIQNDITDYAATLHISIDPQNWNEEETRRWLIWMCAQNQIPDVSGYLPFDGRTLCSYDEESIKLMVGSVDVGIQIYAQIEIWKNACKMAPSAGFYHFQQQQVEDCRFSSEVRNTGYKMMDTGCNWANNERFPEAPSEVNHQPELHSQQASTSLMQQQFKQMASNFRVYEHRSTIPQDRNILYRNVMAQQNQTFSAFSCPPNHDQPTNHSVFYNNFCNEVTRPVYADLQTGNSKPAATTSSSHELGLGYSSVSVPQVSASLSSLITPLSLPQKVANPPKQNGQSSKDEKKTTTPSGKPRKTKHTTHLWEFLKELLVEGKDCIRWIDQEKGIFKIYNSQEVAKYWGQRKNRPAMNYDKLSRSIRQYYKKGIIQKTKQGKRLVYQFCDEYRDR